MGKHDELLTAVFGYKPKNIPPAVTRQVTKALDEGRKIEKAEQKAQDENRELVNPDTSALVQSMVWANGNPPPPKAPPQKQLDTGIAPALGNQEGWGKV
jgi:hypothetical protein